MYKHVGKTSAHPFRKELSAHLRSIALSALVLICCAVSSFAWAEDVPLALSDPVDQHGLQEIAFQLPFEYGNPYDPDEIAVWATFSAPSGRERRVPAFFYKDPRAAQRETGWRVRFTPAETGTYLLKIHASLRREQSREIAVGAFQSQESTRTGFLKRRGRRFVESSGEVFFPIGANRCWGWGNLRDPETYLADMEHLAATGANSIRVWLAPWWVHIEQERGTYDALASSGLDRIFAKAEELGLRVVLCIEQHGNFEPPGAEIGRWPEHPYNAHNGGPCRTTRDFFTHREARRLFRNRLRYLIARWGYSTSLAAWELFNEVELVPFLYSYFEENRRVVADWHRDMAEFLHISDPFEHLIATSSDIPLQKELLADGALDLVTIHLYTYDDPAMRLWEILEPLLANIEAPILVGEFGPFNQNGDGALITRLGFTAAIAGRGTGAFPWLQDMPNPEPAYNRLAAFRRFFKGVTWSEGDSVSVLSEESFTVFALKQDHMTLVYAYEPEAGEARTVRFVLSGHPGGKYTITVSDPAEGKVLYWKPGVAGADGLPVTIQGFSGETALRIEALGADEE